MDDALLAAAQSNAEALAPIEPATDLIESSPGEWKALFAADPVAGHIAQTYWRHPQPPEAWEFARFSRAVYLYRETASRWILAVKYYAPKTGSSAAKYAEREFQRIEQVRSAGLADGPERAIRPLGPWRGVIILEYVDGLTLADAIAVRRSRPGQLADSLAGVARLLARLHAMGARPDIVPDTDPARLEGAGYVDELQARGVLKDEPAIADGLRQQIERRIHQSDMSRFTPALTHGDATTTNFICPGDGQVVAIDWERLEVADPAADLGRLAAEVSHSVRLQGGTGAEVDMLTQRMIEAYARARADVPDVDGLARRVRFYQATSTLRIARNSWVSPSDRITRVTEALILLA